MKKLEPNPYNVFEVRRLNYPPFHFEYASIPMRRYNIGEAVSKWVETHLKSRYYLGKELTILDGTDGIAMKIGFENPKEMSYFMLACPHLKYN